jgi:hypothetical protein
MMISSRAWMEFGAHVQLIDFKAVVACYSIRAKSRNITHKISFFCLISSYIAWILTLGRFACDFNEIYGRREQLSQSPEPPSLNLKDGPTHEYPMGDPANALNFAAALMLVNGVMCIVSNREKHDGILVN